MMSNYLNFHFQGQGVNKISHPFNVGNVFCVEVYSFSRTLPRALSCVIITGAHISWKILCLGGLINDKEH